MILDLKHLSITVVVSAETAEVGNSMGGRQDTEGRKDML